MDELRRAALVRDEPGGSRELTDEGCDTLERLAHARREHLRELASEWNLEGDEDAAARLRRLTADLVPDAPRRRAG